MNSKIILHNFSKNLFLDYSHLTSENTESNWENGLYPGNSRKSSLILIVAGDLYQENESNYPKKILGPSDFRWINFKTAICIDPNL